MTINYDKTRQLCRGLIKLGCIEIESVGRTRVFLPTEKSEQAFPSGATRILVGSRTSFRGVFKDERRRPAGRDTFRYNSEIKELVLKAGEE